MGFSLERQAHCVKNLHEAVETTADWKTVTGPSLGNLVSLGVSAGASGAAIVGFVLENVGANAVDWRLRCSIDGRNWTYPTPLDETGADVGSYGGSTGKVLSSGSVVHFFVTPSIANGVVSAYADYELQVRSSSPGAPSTVKGAVCAK